MVKYLCVLIAISFILPGCASAQSPPTAGRFAWDGLGQDPNRPVRHKRRPGAALSALAAVKPPDPNIEREKVLAALRPYSTAWWAVQDAMEAEEQKRINAKMVICRACLPPPGRDEYTASLRP